MLSNKPDFGLNFDIPREVLWIFGAVLTVAVAGLILLSSNVLGAPQVVF